jgi:hypothetical protein
MHTDKKVKILFFVGGCHLGRRMIATMVDLLSMLSHRYIYTATKTNFANAYQLI